MSAMDAGAPPVEWAMPPGAKQDWLFGTGATTAERGLVLAGSLVGIGVVAASGALADVGWAPWQLALAALIAADLFGGAVANACGSNKRQYFGPMPEHPGVATRLARSRLGFAALHVYPIVIALLFPGVSLAWGIAWYVAMLVATAIMEWIPPYLQRPGAMLLFVAAVAVAAVLSWGPGGWEWFVPVFFAKLVLAHAVREEPYRPAPGT